MEDKINTCSADTKTYWDTRWQQDETGWDIGYASPALMEYMQQQTEKHAAILIPGCGNAHEAAALLDIGFTNITLIDISEIAVNRVKKRFGNQVKSICTDFFDHQGSYDFILEQTFFCALLPELRDYYVTKMAALLHSNAILAGVLFSTEFNEPGPPFGGSKQEYEKLFTKNFKLLTLEPCYNSIPHRQGNELFIEFKKS